MGITVSSKRYLYLIYPPNYDPATQRYAIYVWPPEAGCNWVWVYNYSDDAPTGSVVKTWVNYVGACAYWTDIFPVFPLDCRP